MTFESSINRIYNGNFIDYGRHPRNDIPTIRKFLEVPVSKSDLIEIPTVALHKITRRGVGNIDDLDNIVVDLFVAGQTPGYKSLEAIFKDAMLQLCGTHGLVEVKVEQSHRQPEIYYMGDGAIFDKDLNPLAITTWLIRKAEHMDGWRVLHYHSPVLRIDPNCFRKRNKMENFIVGKLLNTVTSYHPEIDYGLNPGERYSFARYGISVIIENMPFKVLEPKVPSTTTTPEDLMNIVLQNQEEFLCR